MHESVLCKFRKCGQKIRLEVLSGSILNLFTLEDLCRKLFVLASKWVSSYVTMDRLKDMIEVPGGSVSRFFNSEDLTRDSKVLWLSFFFTLMYAICLSRKFRHMFGRSEPSGFSEVCLMLFCWTSEDPTCCWKIHQSGLLNKLLCGTHSKNT